MPYSPPHLKLEMDFGKKEKKFNNLSSFYR